MVRRTGERYVYAFSEGNAEMKALLGGKGANLAQMTVNGIPVPPGFTVTTAACLEYLRSGPGFLDSIWDDIRSAVHDIENTTDKVFGGHDKPLLVSVRSGAPVSMPGMMDTILNLGLNRNTVESIARISGDRRFAFDSYRRFIQMYSNVVMGIDGEIFESALRNVRRTEKVNYDHEISAPGLEGLAREFLDIYKSITYTDFPEDPWDQLRSATESVFGSWNNQRAKTYRKFNSIPDDLGTAVNVVAMVYGNSGNTSGTGVCFTRNPATGTKELYGEFLVNAQGEDVVAGIRTPMNISGLKDVFPEIHKELIQICNSLESFYRDMQDIEFTIEKGKLFILQTRTGKRSAAAAVKVSVDMVNEGLIDKRSAISRVTPQQVELLLHDRFDPQAKVDELVSGLPASPGAAVGEIVFDPDEAVTLTDEGKKVILVRPETTPDDVHGLYAAQGVVTSRGGMTSHAAVVARGMGKPCVSGCESLEVDLENEVIRSGDKLINKGDILSIDGSTGRVVLGEIPLVRASLSKDFEIFLDWCDEIATLEVWANSDTPEDALRARKFGAMGIGLCRTEHMFMAPDRLPVMQEMIIAEDPGERDKRLSRLQDMQKEDFKTIFTAMDGLPVIIRLLDPPLHEFLPKEEELLGYLSDIEESGYRNTKEYEKVHKAVEMVRNLREANPMMGFRGCRLGIIHPEIYEMQVRSIFEALTEVKAKGIDVIPEIMIPLVGVQEELVILKKMIIRIAGEFEHSSSGTFSYRVGTMIELPRAVCVADKLAQHAEFFSFGTNDLTQTTLGISRDDAEAKFLLKYVDQGIMNDNPFHSIDREGVGSLMAMAVQKGRSIRPEMSIGICGEHGGDPSSIAFCHSLGLNYVSCSPYRVPVARIAAAHAEIGLIN